MEPISQGITPRPLLILPKRAKGQHMDKFRKLELLTNHYQVKLRNFTKIVIFRVKITPQIAFDNRTLRKELMDKIMPDLSKMIAQPILSGFNVYSHEEAAEKEKDFECESRNTVYIVNIKQVKIYDLSLNPKFLLTFLNNGLRNVMQKINYVQIGKTGKYFSTHEKKEVDNLILYNGFKANFVHLENGYYLRVDSAKKVVRNESVLDAIDNFYSNNRDKDKEDKRNTLKTELTDKIIMTNYGTTRYYKIVDIQFKRADEVMIENDVSIATYFEKRYGMKITKPHQPLLEVEVKKSLKDKGPVLLLPEFCLMTGIPDNFDEMRRKKISEYSIKNPPEKVVEIQALMNELKGTDEIKALSEFGMEIKHTMSKIQAKGIPVPQLQLGGMNSVEQGKESYFNLFNKPIYSSKHDIECGIVFFKGTDIRQLITVFESTSKNLKVTFSYKEYEVQGRNARELQSKACSIKESVNICLIILPNAMKNDYKKIKNQTVQEQIITQVVTDGVLRKKNLQSIATKVLLQVIAKRGNTLWVPQTKFEYEATMLLAFDTAKTNSKTLISAVATVNSTFNSLHSEHEIYESNENKYIKMIKLTMQNVEAYFNRNDRVPKELVIFFNSCTGDQVSLYQTQYFDILIERLNQAYKNNTIAITGIMVNTKNSQRFFVQDSQIRNVPAGTLISQGFVSENYDFFIVSQQSNRGSTVPNHYRVIFSNSKLEEGGLHELIFSQCFNYVNWTGSIKVPAILQYAKKCSKFLGEILEVGEVPYALRCKPYFI